MALALYLVVSAALSILRSRFVQRVSVAAAIVLVAVPLLFTGRAMFTNRVYAPLDLPFTAEPLRDYANGFGVAKPHDIALSERQQAVDHLLDRLRPDLLAALRAVRDAESTRKGVGGNRRSR